MTKINILTPSYCPICRAKWLGGASKPRQHLKAGMPVYYRCGLKVVLYQEEDYFKVVYSNCQGKVKER